MPTDRSAAEVLDLVVADRAGSDPTVLPASNNIHPPRSFRVEIVRNECAVPELLKPTPENVESLDRLISCPRPGAIDALGETAGDIVVLGAGGKMGFHLCMMLRRILKQADSGRRLLAVSRFDSEAVRQRFTKAGIETVAADLSDAASVRRLPHFANVFYLAGVKFGTAADKELLTRMNVTMPSLVADYYRNSRIVALSTGCVYSFTKPVSGGSTEAGVTEPPGEYAASCKGREQAFVDAAARHGTRSALVRLNYAIDLRYGVLVDIARKIVDQEPVDVSMGYVNLIWQGDALDHIISCLPRASAPPWIINVAGSEIHRIRDIAAMLAAKMQRDLLVCGSEHETAWLSNASKSHALFGQPNTSLRQMVAWVADWIGRGGETLGKPTHFETRDGQY